MAVKNAFTLATLAAIAVAQCDLNDSKSQPNLYANSTPAAVFAAQANAHTYQGETTHVSGKVFDRFIQIWLEKASYGDAVHDPNLMWLASQGIHLSNYFGVTHPSQPNYIAASAGDNLGCQNDNFTQVAANVSTVVDLLEDKGILWATYQEDMPFSGFQGNQWQDQIFKANDYERKHNPLIKFDANTNCRRLSYQKNLTQFNMDLEGKRLPQWAFITPNMQHNGHDTDVAHAGAWAREFLEPLLKNENVMERTLILLAYDANEERYEGNRVWATLLGGAVPKSLQGSTDSQYYNHYSTLSTVEANWDLHTLGRWDVGANVFKIVADKTGDKYTPDEAVTDLQPSVFLNASFQGPFNGQSGVGFAPYPIPNTNMVVNGRTVLPGIVDMYKDMQNSKNMYYNSSVVIPDGQHPPPGYIGGSFDV
ncbi:hypothetical protein BST61_g2054 [Cercospora zeina]